jgi:hypothetical protein
MREKEEKEIGITKNKQKARQKLSKTKKNSFSCCFEE